MACQPWQLERCNVGLTTWRRFSDATRGTRSIMSYPCWGWWQPPTLVSLGLLFLCRLERWLAHQRLNPRRHKFRVLSAPQAQAALRTPSSGCPPHSARCRQTRCIGENHVEPSPLSEYASAVSAATQAVTVTDRPLVKRLLRGARHVEPVLSAAY